MLSAMLRSLWRVGPSRYAAEIEMSDGTTRRVSYRLVNVPGLESRLIQTLRPVDAEQFADVAIYRQPIYYALGCLDEAEPHTRTSRAAISRLEVDGRGGYDATLVVDGRQVVTSWVPAASDPQDVEPVHLDSSDIPGLDLRALRKAVGAFHLARTQPYQRFIPPAVDG